MTANKFMTLDEALKRRFHYRGQLRRHKNAKRNAAIREFWKSKITAEMETGSGPRAVRASANEAASKKFNISRSQVRRALNDIDYLIDAASLRLRIHDLRDLQGFQKRFISQRKRIECFEDHVAAAIQKGYTPANAHFYGVKRTAEEFGITHGPMRRILHTFEFGGRRKK
jgi:hypothetical protein